MRTESRIRRMRQPRDRSRTSHAKAATLARRQQRQVKSFNRSTN